MDTYAQDSQKFAREANYIIANMDSGEIIRIITDCFNKSLEAIIISKGHAIKNTGKSIIKLGKHTGKSLKNEFITIRYNPEEYIGNILPRTIYSFKNFRDMVIDVSSKRFNEFKKLSLSDKKSIIVSGLLWFGTIIIVGGGTDFEGGIPDLDIKLGGIGRHRNVFSHTILLGLSLEFFTRVTIILLKYGKDYLPDDRSKVWNSVGRLIDEIDRNQEILVSGAWMGLSIHLLKDANVLGSRVKPYVGMPRPLSMEAHQNIFAGNSFISFVFGKEHK